MKSIVIRAAIMFLILIAVATIGLTTRQSLTNARDSTKAIMSLATTLTDFAAKPQPLPPAQDAGSGGEFHDYAYQLEAAQNRLPKPLSVQGTGFMAWAGGSSLVNYNSIVSGTRFVEAYDRSQQTLGNLRSELSHETAVMKVLAGLLDYPAGVDLEPDDPALLTPQVKAAITGLNSAADKLGKLKAANDPSLTVVSDQLLLASSAYKDLLAVVGLPAQTNAKVRAIAQIETAQLAIISNRTSYTVIQNRLLGDSCRVSGGGLTPYTEQLRQIQYSQ